MSKAHTNLEYKFAEDLKACGEDATFRVPLSGSSRMVKGDVQSQHFFGETKRRKNFAFVNWFKKAEAESPKGKETVLVIKYHRQRGYYVVMHREIFMRLLKFANENGMKW